MADLRTSPARKVTRRPGRRSASPYPHGVRSGSLPYVPALDGLRGVVVALVVCAHSLPGFTVGRVGVDIFFVLSGYLITTILLGEWRANARIDLRAFYVPRFLRLFRRSLLSSPPTWRRRRCG
ncbi:acyltransferase family protein [Terrabacter sp. LjRoot27]|uniref:acyltransferase family protein n=1 Tax=Terrabacter sp. LjRoot27 TaxID=3342306 RepID=UPI003F4FAF55